MSGITVKIECLTEVGEDQCLEMLEFRCEYSDNYGEPHGWSVDDVIRCPKHGLTGAEQLAIEQRALEEVPHAIEASYW